MDIALSPAVVLPLLSALLSILWIALVALRIYRLARYFQLEGYESKRYLRWWLRNPRERRYFLLTVMALALLAEPARSGFWLFSRLAWAPGAGPVAVLQVEFAIAVAVMLFALLPRDRQIKQKFARTQRAMRLLATALIVGAALPILTLLAPVPIYLNRWPYEMDVMAVLASVLGGVAFVLAPLLLPLANVLLWPVEEAFRRYYLLLAKRNLRRSGATVICITGSYGKTSTKHYLQHILEGRFRSLMTPKSFNTLMGISRVINDVFARDVSYEYFIVEADAYFVGENARICKLVEPQIGMVMSVGPMHLERLGSMENTARAQYEIVEALPPDGVAVFNGDDPQVFEMAGRGYPQTRLIVSQQGAPGARLKALNVRMEADGLHFDVHDTQTGEQRDFHAPLYGTHNVTNILMAAMVAGHLGMSLAEIALRVSTLQPAEHRLIRRALPDGTVIIDDAYSANPVGTQTALEVLALERGLKPDGRRVVVSSGMFELGALQDEENRKLGERIAATATDAILIGSRQTVPVKEGLLGKEFPPDRLHVVETLNEAVEVYRRLIRPGDALLMLTDLPDTYA